MYFNMHSCILLCLVLIHLSAVPNRGQKRVSDPLDHKLWVVVRAASCECWEPNSGPLLEQYTVLTSQRLSHHSSPHLASSLVPHVVSGAVT